MLWCCVDPDRLQKTSMIMRQLARGWPGGRLVQGQPPADRSAFAIWGQMRLARQVLPGACAAKRPFWHIDNGFWRPARGSPHGYYRMTYRGLSAVFLRDAPPARGETAIGMAPWRRSGRHIVFAHPGRDFGKPVGLDMGAWIAATDIALRHVTDRPIVGRAKDCIRPLTDDLANAWALVTHSSNVAVDAVIAGIPVFVAPTSPAAPVGSLDLASIETPVMPDRDAWWASLMSQQFTIDEMRAGTAYAHLEAVRQQVDGR